jgi:hypothetical protein
MYIDLDDGSIYGYNFTLESYGNDTYIRLSTKEEPYFLVERDVPLIYIGDSKFYLQSNDYDSGETGMFINLDEGEIFAHTFTLETDGLRLSTYDPYF